MCAHRVAITGIGVISPYGGDAGQFFERLLAGESAVRHLHTDDLPKPLSTPFVGCTGFDPEATLGKPLALMMERFSQLGVAAAFQAWDQAGLPRQRIARNPHPAARPGGGAAVLRVFLDHDDFEAQVRSGHGGRQRARAGADDQQVAVFGGGPCSVHRLAHITPRKSVCAHRWGRRCRSRP